MMNSNDQQLDFDAIRKAMAQKRGRPYWQTLEELANAPQFQRQASGDEFARGASEWPRGMNRRQFLQLIGASLALAGVVGCDTQPAEFIVPYVNKPEDVTPGEPLFFATAMPFRGFGQGLIVESHEGRPTKAEGNPDHPASLGATSAIGQASILGLYDPDRAQTVTTAGRVSTWGRFLAFWARTRLELARSGSQDKPLDGVYMLTDTVTSPTLTSQLEQFEQQGGTWLQYEPVSADNALQGAQAAFGKPVHSIYQFDKAQCILSLDDNFLLHHPGSLRYAREFSNRRRVRAADGQAIIAPAPHDPTADPVTPPPAAPAARPLPSASHAARPRRRSELARSAPASGCP